MDRPYYFRPDSAMTVIRRFLVCLLAGGLEHIFPSIGNVIIRIDFHIFQRGRLNHQPETVEMMMIIFDHTAYIQND